MIGKILSFLHKNYIDYVFYALFFCYCMYVSLSVGYWHDELTWTLMYVHKTSFFEMLHELTTTIYNLPLYYVFLYIFYMVSDNTEWLRLPSVLATMGAMYYIQKLVSEYYGKIYKIAVWIIFCCAPIVLFISLRVRPYAFMLFFSAYSFYLYYKRLDNLNAKNIIKYGISLTFLTYSHWYGSLMVASYGLMDLYYFMNKKLNIKFILSYFICFFLFLPWLILLLLNHKYDFLSYWGRSESYLYFIQLIYNVLGNKLVSVLAICALFMFFKKTKTEKGYFSPYVFSIFSIFFIWTISWLYSVINPKGSITEIRYFFVFIPQLIVLVVAFIAEINTHNIKLICRKFNQTTLITFMIIGMLSLYALYNYLYFSSNDLKYEFSGYKELLDQYKKDAEKNKTLIWFYSLNFLSVYNLNNADVISYQVKDNYNATFFSEYKNIDDKNKYFDTLNKIKHMPCEYGVKYILDVNQLRLYNNYVQGKEDTSLSKINVCEYDIIYVEYKTLLVPYIKTFLEQYYDISEMKLKNEKEIDIYKFVRKK